MGSKVGVLLVAVAYTFLASQFLLEVNGLTCGYLKEVSSCEECPILGNLGNLWCRGDCKWLQNKCVNKTYIPQDGGWSPWTPFTTCLMSKNSGIGIKAKKRLCDTPVPSFGGRYCYGNSVETRRCKPPLKLQLRHCDVPRFEKGKSLTHVVKKLTQLTQYIRYKQPDISRSIKELQKDIVNSEWGYVNVSQVRREYNDLTVLLSSLMSRVRPSDHYRINNDIWHTRQFLHNLIILEREREEERADKVKNKIKTVAIASRLDGVLFDLETHLILRPDDYLMDESVASEELKILNIKMKTAIQDLKKIFC